MCETGNCEKCKIENGLALELIATQIEHESDFQKLTLYRATMSVLEAARHAGPEKFIEMFDENLKRLKELEKCQ